MPALQTTFPAEWPFVLLFFLLMLALLYRFRPAERRNVMVTLLFLVLGALGVWFAKLAIGSGIHDGGVLLLELASIGLGMVVIRLVGLVFFRLLLSSLRLEPPRILEDVIVFVGYLAWGMVRLRYGGVELSSLVTTSAVITAVAAFSMQDTLGNILSGIALQLDDSLDLGQWVKLGDISGKVRQIGWRSTLIETPNGETVVVPNGWLMKNSFQIIGKRFNGSGQVWRRWVWFELSWDHPPATVIERMQLAMQQSAIDGVATEPAPQAVLMETRDGIARYALRYWLTDFARDDPTDSAVRAHVITALLRHGMPLAANTHNVLMTKENDKAVTQRQEQELARRMAALKGVSLFAEVTDKELRQLASHLRFAPFEAGDLISRQGAVANWLYILAEGEVEIWQDYDSAHPRMLGSLSSGSFFGEMGLMTGAPRTATVVATRYTECYRLDRPGFEAILTARPALAETISSVLAARLAENQRRSQDQDAPAAPQQHEVLERIRRFFRLD